MKNLNQPLHNKTLFSMLLLKKILPALLLCAISYKGNAQSTTYSTPGAYTTTVPAGCTTMYVTVTGAAGGNDGGAGGKGGSVSATYSVIPGTIYYIYVGAKAANSGGSSGGSSYGGGEDGGQGGYSGPADGGGGGAASDIRSVAGSLSSRIAVGGGGGGGMGGGCSGTAAGGNGGYTSGSAGGTGGSGCGCSTTGGGGGTQTTGGARGGSSSCSDATAGSLGAGGGSTSGTGGGGGGYYGGGAAYNGGGGGGSSYASSTSIIGSATFSNGVNSGDGSVTVCFSPSSITGPTTVCPGGTMYLSDGTPGGTWTSSNTSVATINSSTGEVFGIAGGTTNISYSAGACPAVMTVTVTTVPAISGPTSTCVGSSIVLSDASTGGVWSSDNTSVATVSGSVVVTGASVGSAHISYTVGSCATGVAITVTAPPGAISGSSSSVCVGSAIQLSDATTGGTWSSGNTALATITSSGFVAGVSGGTVVISYATSSSCFATYSLTVISMQPITGPVTVCPGSTISLTDITPGGSWSSDNTSLATVSSTGVVSGVSAGTVHISYTVSTCTVVSTINVGALPAIVGATAVCPTNTTQLSDTTPGGVWSSNNTTVATVTSTGLVTGGSAGTAVISYSIGTCSTTTSVTVAALGPITGNNTLCGGSSTQLSDITPGGIWSSSNTGVATVSASGVVYGVSSGTSVIDYSTGTCFVSVTITVSGVIAPITGTTTVCLGSTTHLTDATTGGVWTSNNTAVATVNNAGTAGGVGAGTTVISYTVGSCSVGVSVTVTSVPAISGPTNVCAGSTITLSDSAPGGVWSSGLTTVATVSPGGVVSGVTSGTATIYYTIGACDASIIVNVGSAVAPITGNNDICVGATTALSDATAGGTWSSDNTSVLTVSGSGVGSGVSAGTATVSYTSGACSVTMLVTVDANNAGTITGHDTVCIGSTTSLSDAVPGGTWSSSNTARATVTATTGVVTGVSYGIVTITYTVVNSCGTHSVTVVMHVLPAGSCPTGIAPVAGSINTELKVFPNPNGGTFTMNLTSDIDEPAQAEITNIMGQRVSEFMTVTNKATDVRLDPAPGVYLLSVNTSHGRYFAKVVVYR